MEWFEIRIFALGLSVLPSSGYVPVWDEPYAGVRSLILPVSALALPSAGTPLMCEKDVIRPVTKPSSSAHVVPTPNAVKAVLLDPDIGVIAQASRPGSR